MKQAFLIIPKHLLTPATYDSDGIVCRLSNRVFPNYNQLWNAVDRFGINGVQLSNEVERIENAAVLADTINRHELSEDEIIVPVYVLDSDLLKRNALYYTMAELPEWTEDCGNKTGKRLYTLEQYGKDFDEMLKTGELLDGYLPTDAAYNFGWQELLESYYNFAADLQDDLLRNMMGEL